METNTKDFVKLKKKISELNSHKLFEEGELKIIQNLGYPQPVLSHFRSIELWETGGDGTSKGRDGWLIQSLNHISKKSKFDAKAIHLDTSPGVFKGGFDGYLDIHQNHL